MKDKHTAAFVQETFELLEVLETALLELETKPGDKELIGKVFRALHTIKGAGGMFGYDDIAAFVHDIESVFDKIRNDELKVNNEIIDLTLKARDIIKQMVNGENAADLNDKEILSAFKKYLSVQEPVINEEKVTVPENVPGEKIVYKIFFVPDEDLFFKGTKPTGLLQELCELGDAIIIPDTKRIPDLNEINPEKLYTSWNIILSTSKGINSIKDVFIFVEDDCRIEIKEIDKGELKGGVDYYQSIINKKEEDSTQLNKDVKKVTSSADKSENKKQNIKNNKPAATENISSIRVSSDKLDLLVNLVGELVTVQARLAQTADKKKDPELLQISEIVERLTWELRDNALNIRMLPIESTFNKFNRLVRDLSRELGKEVELITDGGETELDKNVIEKLNDPLVHIIRNCIDHGIENGEERIKKGKDKSGKIFLSAMHSGTHVLIKIEDDGAGLNKEAILKKAVERGVISEDAKLSDKEIYNLIFQPGFSTAKEITNVSGRGVGLDVVKTAIESLRGTFDVESKTDSGTIITLKLPLTLAIIEGLIVRIDEDFFAIPLSFVEECVELTLETKKKSNGRNLLRVRGEIIPYIPLRKKFNILNNTPSIEQVVIINEDGTKTGLVVDEIIGERQTVIKSLGSYYKNVDVMSGATVLGDGTVALIIDVPKLIYSEIIEEKLFVETYSE
jgi:two-component system chemotaxis sensor kinase CheA